MHILLTNDDGVFAPGLAAIYNQLKTIADVSVVAPAEAKSGASHSITLEPLVCEKIDIAGKFVAYIVEGTPVDCVNLALNQLIDTDARAIDMIVSGINNGANVGLHVHYSGTVAAAMEGAFCGIPSIAVSAAFEEGLDFEAAAKYALDVIKKLVPLKPENVINVNIPLLSKGEPKGVKVTRHSTSSFEQGYMMDKNDNGQTVYQYTSAEHREEGGTLTDTAALADGFITVTALHFDSTDYEKNRTLDQIEW